MTEPDEALLWARGSAYLRCLEYYDGNEAEARAQMENKDAYDVAGWLAEAYRAGAAASAERIKALEAALRSVVDDYDWVRDGPGDRDWNVLDNTIIRARALLKGADQ